MEEGLKMTNTNITNFRKDIYKLLEQTIKFNEPINITTKDGNAVVISEEDYNSIMETLYITSIPNLKDEIISRTKDSEDKYVDESEVKWQGLYIVKFHKKAIKEITKLKENKLDVKAKRLIEIIKENPYQNPPPYEKLVGDLKDLYSRRINIQHRIIYQVNEADKVVKIVSLWSHYENVQMNKKLQ